ncbi:hypothetical protein FRX31_005754 [Thalictrum thalictroides]|uniref:Uncharacterized protein n=1 Tax=Thalictrum thalictroides TaxID=46969 RepID=A0A7J6X7W7_THATH|nr:hypothetical protein FRX31_005754 [Thalictrum thalictroides]
MTVYKWPRSTIKEIEQYLRNFIWSGNPGIRKATKVAWHKMCAPIQEGGVGIRYLKDINLSMLMQMAWELKLDDTDWGHFMRGKYLKSIVSGQKTRPRRCGVE